MADNNQFAELYKTVALNVLLPIVMAGFIGVLGWIGKIEDRQYNLQAEAVTEQKLGTTEQRIMGYIDVRMKDLDNKMNMVIRQLELLNSKKE